MKQLLLSFLVFLGILFITSPVSAQEACSQRCPSGSQQSGPDTCTNTAGVPQSLEIYCPSGKTPSDTNDLNNCICNPLTPAVGPVSPPTPASQAPLDVKPCQTTDTIDESSPTVSTETSGNGTTFSVKCPGGSVCFKFKQGSEFNCFKGPAGAAAAAAVPVCDPKLNNCSKGGGVKCAGGISTAIGCVPTEPKAFVEGLLKFLTLGAGGIAFLLMLLASLEMITAEGSAEAIKKAQEKFYSAIIGLLLIIFSVLLMQVIGVDILGLPGFGPN